MKAFALFFLSLFFFLSFSCGEEVSFSLDSPLEEQLAGQLELVQVFLNGGNNTGTEPSAFVDITSFKQSGDFLAFLKEVEVKFPSLRDVCTLSEEGTCDPLSFRIYNWKRWRISSTTQLVANDLLYIVPANESFIWPGLYIGHKVSLEVPVYTNEGKSYRTIQLETVSLQPRAFVMEEFLTDEECEAVMEVGKPSLFSSTIGEEAKLSTTERNSETAWLYATDDRIKNLFNRASFVTHTPQEHQEALQLLHYRPGGFYNSHCDYFGEPGCAVKANKINRFITLLFYLSDVEGGGGTTFWRVKGVNDTDDPWQRHTSNVSCSGGLVTQPKKRRSLMFYNLFPYQYRTEPHGDRMSEHTACNVTAGEKWAANFWIWNNHRNGVPDEPHFYNTLDNEFLMPAEFTEHPSTAADSHDTGLGVASPELTRAAHEVLDSPQA